MTELRTTGGDTSADDERSTGGPTIAPTPYTLSELPTGRLTATSCDSSTPGGGRRTTSRWGRSTCSTTHCCASRCAPSTSKPRLLGHFGTVPGLNLVRRTLNRVIRRPRPRRRVRRRTGPRRARARTPAPGWRARTPSLYPRHPGRAAWRRSSASSPFPAGCRATARRRRRGRSTRAVSSGTRCCMRTAPRSTTPTSSWCAWSVTVRPRPAAGGQLARNKFLNPARDGAVLPILHLNEYKIANPTCWPASPRASCSRCSAGYGYEPHVVVGRRPGPRAPGDGGRGGACLDAIAAIQAAARHGDESAGSRWPMIVLRTPKGWTGPPVVDGMPVEGTFRAHQVPLPAAREDDDHRRVLEAWMRGLPAGGAVRRRGRPCPSCARSPRGDRRMSANPVATAARCCATCDLPDWRDHAVEVARARRIDARGDAGARRVAARGDPPQSRQLPDWSRPTSWPATACRTSSR